MMTLASTGLSGQRRPVIMRAAVVSAALLLLCLFADTAAAQQQKSDDLDVTMQIIVDPNAKLPDEVVRRIPLPARKSAATSSAAATGQPDKSGKQEPAGADKERDNAANEHGKETSEAAQERAREAADQREQARRSKAEERREHEPPGRPDPPGPPPRN